MADRALLPVPLDAIGKVDLTSFQEPWLVSVSSDLTQWEIQDIGGFRPKKERINLDIELADGSRLTDPKNKALFETCVEYLQIFRLYRPYITASFHAENVRALLVFCYWLSQHRIRDFTAVTAEHIVAYTKGAMYGHDWSIGAPHALVAYLQRLVAQGGRPPTLRGASRYRIHRARALQAAGIPLSCLRSRYCPSIFTWFEKSKFTADLSAPTETILSDAGAELRPVTVGTLHNKLVPLEDVYGWRTLFSNPTFPHNPFPRGAHTVARRHGRARGRTRTIPPKVGIALLEAALKWVLVYAEPILKAVAKGDKAAVLQRRLSALGCPITVVDSGRNYSLKTRTFRIRTVIDLLATAAFIVIAMLTARRRYEIEELTPGSCFRDAAGDYWLHVYIAKTLQRHENIPVPAAVYHAVTVMETLSASARAESDDPSIWQIKRPGQGAVIRLQPADTGLNVFRDVCGAPETDWRFTAHQFRRFFATLYFWWYDGSTDIAALSHHLRHFDIEMTRQYVTAIDYGAQWRDAHEEWKAAFFRDAVYGGRRISGKAGRRLTQLAEKLQKRFRKDIDVLPRHRVVNQILRIGKRLGAPFKLHVWGTICACPQLPAFSRHARCKGSADTGPVFENACESACGECPFAIHTERFLPQAQAALQKRRALSAASPDSLLKTMADAECVSLEAIIAKGEAGPLADSADTGE